jgi:integrase
MRSPESIRRPGNPAKGIKPYVMYVARLPTGKKTFPRFKDAQAAIMEYESAVKAGVDLKKRTVGDVLKEFMLEKYSESSGARQATRNNANLCAAKIEAEFGTWPLDKVRRQHVVAWQGKLIAATRAAETAKLEKIKARLTKSAQDKRATRARRKLAAYEADKQTIEANQKRKGFRAAEKALDKLRAMYAFSIEGRYCVFNPCAGVSGAKPPADTDKPLDTNVFNVQEIVSMLAAAPPEYRPLLMVLVYGGIRIGEASGLRWGDLELSKNRFRVAQQRESCTGNITKPKTKASVRFVTIPRSVAQALREHELRTKKGSPTYVFPYHMRRFRDNVYFPTLRRAKLRRIRIHDLRHTAASLLIATNAPLAAISRQIGHSKLGTTLNIYGHFFEQRTDSDLGAKLEELVRRETDGPVLVPSDDSAETA